MKIYTYLTSILIIVGLCSTNIQAGVPNAISFQGTMTDSAGNPITGTRTLSFYLFADSTGGTSMWNELHSSVEIRDGLFRVILGSNNPLLSSIFDGTTRWITARVAPESTTLSPRQPLVTVPYSFKTMKSDSADHADFAEYADDASYADEAAYADFASIANSATYADTANYAHVGSPDNDWVISGDNLYSEVSGNVGIGTGSPSEKLDVNGTVKMTGFQLTGSRGAGDVLTSDANGVGTWQAIDEFTLPVNDSVATSNPVLRLTNTYNGTYGSGIFGTHNYSGNYGYLASNLYGVYGQHLASGNYGALGASNAGVYGAGANGYAGYFVGDVYAGGDVGIGTQNPNNKLDVQGAMAVGNWYSGTFTAPVDGMIIQGDVGIGCTAPLDKLEVNGYIRVNSISGIKFGGSDTRVYRSSDDLYATASDDIYLSPTDDIYIRAHDSTDWARFDTGNERLGIGTTSPDAQLDVDGDIKLGTNGSTFLEIREITATSASSGILSNVAPPYGYTSDNTHALSVKIHFQPPDGWIYAGHPSNDLHFGFVLIGTYLSIVHPDIGNFHDTTIKAIVMKMP